jgi:hypothetical protein
MSVPKKKKANAEHVATQNARNHAPHPLPPLPLPPGHCQCHCHCHCHNSPQIKNDKKYEPWKTRSADFGNGKEIRIGNRRSLGFEKGCRTVFFFFFFFFCWVLVVFKLILSVFCYRKVLFLVLFLGFCCIGLDFGYFCRFLFGFCMVFRFFCVCFFLIMHFFDHHHHLFFLFFLQRKRRQRRRISVIFRPFPAEKRDFSSKNNSEMAKNGPKTAENGTHAPPE